MPHEVYIQIFSNSRVNCRRSERPSEIIIVQKYNSYSMRIMAYCRGTNIHIYIHMDLDLEETGYLFKKLHQVLKTQYQTK